MGRLELFRAFGSFRFFRAFCFFLLLFGAFVRGFMVLFGVGFWAWGFRFRALGL